MREAGCGTPPMGPTHGHTRQQLPVLLSLVLLLPVCLRGAAAQEPIGAPAACSAGHTFSVVCFIDSSGYLADVQFSNTQRNTPVSACGSQQRQLDNSRPEVIEISSSDTFLRMRACGDAGGLRGLEFKTALGEVLSCGRPQVGSCRVFSSRSTYPLRGFQATCENLNPGNRHRGQSVVTRVSSIKAACWTPARQPAPGVCPPGQGVQGGGLPCQVCPVSFFSPGGSSPCKRCPVGTTTLTTGQSKCGCFPGYGVYGPVNQDPDVCEECPAGTYAIGGALAPCQPCSTNAFDYLTSESGSLSIADCTCAAGFGVTAANPNTCTMCDRNFFSEGAFGPSQLLAAKASIARMPAPTSRPLPLTGPKTSSGVRQPANLATGASAPAAPPKSSSQVQQPPAPTDAPPSAPAPAVPAMSAAPSLLPPPSLAKAQQARQQQDGVAKAPQLLESAAAATGAAGVRSRQQGAQAVSTASVVRQQQVNPVFSTPTYYPCTFCGPGCTTDGPGATSPQQCSCFVIRPDSPSPPSPPSPPGPSPSPSRSPSPSPPSPPSPSPPTPSPGLSPSPSPSGPRYCVECDTNKITQTMSNLCRSNPDASFPILGDSLNGPCYVAFVGTTVRDWTSEPVNIFSQSQGQVSCQLVRVAAGVSIIQFTGSPPATGGCLMPSSYTVIIPSLTSRVGRTRRGTGTGRLHQQGGNDSADRG